MGGCKNPSHASTQAPALAGCAGHKRPCHASERPITEDRDGDAGRIVAGPDRPDRRLMCFVHGCVETKVVDSGGSSHLLLTVAVDR